MGGHLEGFAGKEIFELSLEKSKIALLPREMETESEPKAWRMKFCDFHEN